jgi:hypothetical protein
LGIAISLLFIGTLFLQNITGAKEYSAVKKFVSKVKLAQQQATVENRVYRVAFDLDAGHYSIEASDAEALTFRDPEQRREMEEMMADSMGEDRGEEELAKLIACVKARKEDPSKSCGEIDEVDPEQAVSMLESQSGEKFSAINDQFFEAKFELPSSVRINGVYTPAYGEYLRGNDEDDDVDEDERTVAFLHIFPGGVTEHAVIQFTREGYDDFGYTVELEPLSGKIIVDTRVRDWDDRDYEIPEQGPELDS